MNTTIIDKLVKLVSKQQEAIEKLEAKVEELSAKLDAITSKEEPELEPESTKTVEEAIFTFKIDRACKALNMPNYIEPLYNKPLLDLNEGDIYVIQAMRGLMASLDNDDYGDSVIEGLMELGEILYSISELRK